VDRDNSVGIATRYGLDDPGIESPCVLDFPHPSRPALGDTQRSIEGVPCHICGSSGRGVALNTHPSIAEVKESLELYLLSTSGPSWPVTW